MVSSHKIPKMLWKIRVMIPKAHEKFDSSSLSDPYVNIFTMSLFLGMLPV
jgi:hypothetical protein